MFQTSGSDVLSQTWMVLKALGPFYAIIFGLMGAQRLIEIVKQAIFPPPPKKKTTSRPKRSSIYVASDRNPRVRKTKKGVYVYYE